MADQEIKLFPVQGGGHNSRGGQGQVRESVYMRAYEVYAHCHGEQKAMIEGHCRGGFGKGEMIAFLYASGFPREQWRERAEEALRGMDL